MRIYFEPETKYEITVGQFDNIKGKMDHPKHYTNITEVGKNIEKRLKDIESWHIDYEIFIISFRKVID